jgi:two-component system response regulator ResD
MDRAYKALIVEDDEELRRLYKEIFQSDNFEVFEAADGQSAIDQALLNNPDIIILDLLLPRQGGLHSLKIFRSQPSTQNTPVFVMTAMPNPEYREAAKGQVQGFFYKTQIKPKELVTKAREFLDQHA